MSDHRTTTRPAPARAVRVGLGLLVLALAPSLTACGPAHIQEYEPKKRDYTLDVKTEAPPEAGANGSLWRDDSQAAMLFTDMRAFRIGDLVTIQVDERADAQRSTDTDLSRTSKARMGLSALPLLGPLLEAIAAPAALGDFSATGESGAEFQGEGRTGRTERFTATVPSMVKKVLPGGNLFVEGHRVVLVNDEEHHFYISGVIRPIDIDEKNSIKSSQIADAEIEFVGRGVVSDNQRQGWLSRYLGWAWPF